MQYIEEYANRFHETKDILLEFRLSKQTQAKADKLRKELCRRCTQEKQSVARSKMPRIRQQAGHEKIPQCIHLIYAKSHFKWIKMDLMSHLRDHMCQFHNIALYSTKYGELAHKDQIKEGYEHSNKSGAA